MNEVILMGNICNDLELKRMQGAKGEFVSLNFSLAVQRKYPKADGTKQTDFINISAAGKQAEVIAQYFKKGSKILVKGELNIDAVDKNGQKVYYTKVRLDSFYFCGGGNNQSNQPQAQPQVTSNDGFMNIPTGLEDELPFA